MTRLLVLGDMGGTGFGSVTFGLGRALIDRGEDVRFVSLNERGLPPEVEEPFGSRLLRIGHPNGWIGYVNSPEEAGELAERIRTFMYGTQEDGWSPEAVLMIGDAGSVDRSPAVLMRPEGL